MNNSALRALLVAWVDNPSTNGAPTIDVVQFGPGIGMADRLFGRSEIEALFRIPSGTAGAERLIGFETNDVTDGLAGDDTYGLLPGNDAPWIERIAA